MDSLTDVIMIDSDEDKCPPPWIMDSLNDVIVIDSDKDICPPPADNDDKDRPYFEQPKPEAKYRDKGKSRFIDNNHVNVIVVEPEQDICPQHSKFEIADSGNESIDGMDVEPHDSLSVCYSTIDYNNNPESGNESEWLEAVDWVVANVLRPPEAPAPWEIVDKDTGTCENKMNNVLGERVANRSSPDIIASVPNIPSVTSATDDEVPQVCGDDQPLSSPDEVDEGEVGASLSRSHQLIAEAGDNQLTANSGLTEGVDGALGAILSGIPPLCDEKGDKELAATSSPHVVADE